MLVGIRSKTEYAQGENRRELERLLSGEDERSTRFLFLYCWCCLFKI